MTILIRLSDTRFPLPDEAGTFEGLYLQSYDPDGMDGFGSYTTTADKALAMRFVDLTAAFECWRQQSTRRPWRDDGQPNRPLTAFTVELEEIVD